MLISRVYKNSYITLINSTNFLEMTSSRAGPVAPENIFALLLINSVTFLTASNARLRSNFCTKIYKIKSLFILSTQSRLGSRVSVLYILSLLPVSNDFYDKSKVYANK
jgi:hypothetical protein